MNDHLFITYVHIQSKDNMHSSYTSLIYFAFASFDCSWKFIVLNIWYFWYFHYTYYSCKTKYYAMIHVDSSSFITHTSLIISSYKIKITCNNIWTKISSQNTQKQLQ